MYKSSVACYNSLINAVFDFYLSSINMKFRIPNKLSHQIAVITRKCLYIEIFDKKTGKASFVRKLTKNHYPRFHLYIKESPEEVVFDLHLDQSQTRYENQTAHNADYESDEVKAELTKIYTTVQTFLLKN